MERAFILVHNLKALFCFYCFRGKKKYSLRVNFFFTTETVFRPFKLDPNSNPFPFPIDSRAGHKCVAHELFMKCRWWYKEQPHILLVGLFNFKLDKFNWPTNQFSYLVIDWINVCFIMSESSIPYFIISSGIRADIYIHKYIFRTSISLEMNKVAKDLWTLIRTEQILQVKLLAELQHGEFFCINRSKLLCTNPSWRHIFIRTEIRKALLISTHIVSPCLKVFFFSYKTFAETAKS